MLDLFWHKNALVYHEAVRVTLLPRALTAALVGFCLSAQTKTGKDWKRGIERQGLVYRA